MNGVMMSNGMMFGLRLRRDGRFDWLRRLARQPGCRQSNARPKAVPTAAKWVKAVVGMQHTPTTFFRMTILT